MHTMSIKKKFLSLVFSTTILLFANQAFAENVLSGIEISENQDGYKISIEADKPTEIKKIVSSDDKMVLEMKDITVSPSVNTIYRNVLDVNNVIIEATSKNSAKITFEGESIANSKIFFQSTENVPPMKEETEKTINNNEIELSRPVSEYSPVYSKEVLADLTSDKDITTSMKAGVLGIMRSQTLRSSVKSIIRKLRPYATKENMTYVFLFFAILSLGIKVMLPSKKQTSTTSIGLSSNYRKRELDRVQNMDVEAKIQESKAKSQDMQYTPGSAYAMKSYQNSQKSPYVSSLNRPISSLNGIKRPVMNNTLQTKKTNIQSSPLKKSSLAKNIPNPAMQSSPIAPKANTKKINVDSAKFLESMAKIYEKNGRMDLAKGLKDNMKKSPLISK